MSEVLPILHKAEAELYDFANCETKRDRAMPYNHTDVHYALVATMGDYGQMAFLLGRSRRRVKDYVEAHPELLELREDIRHSIVDTIETEELKAALAGDSTSRRFVLSTLGKERGYSTRVEQTGKDGGPIEHSDPLSKLLETIAKGGGKRLVAFGTDD